MVKCGFLELWRSHGVTCKGIKNSGKAFNCRWNGLRFKPGGPLPCRDLCPVKVTSNFLKYFLRQTLTTLDRKCIGGETTPGLPRGRRDIYH